MSLQFNGPKYAAGTLWVQKVHPCRNTLAFVYG